MTHYGHIFDEGPNNFIYIIIPKNNIFLLQLPETSHLLLQVYNKIRF